ncbi:hypothetical protein PJ912_27085 [Pectobacterium colocasium]
MSNRPLVEFDAAFLRILAKIFQHPKHDDPDDGRDERHELL